MFKNRTSNKSSENEALQLFCLLPLRHHVAMVIFMPLEKMSARAQARHMDSNYYFPARIEQFSLTCSYAFSRAWRRLHVFASSSDWFIGLSAFVVIGQSNKIYMSICFVDLYIPNCNNVVVYNSK